MSELLTTPVEVPRGGGRHFLCCETAVGFNVPIGCKLRVLCRQVIEADHDDVAAADGTPDPVRTMTDPRIPRMAVLGAAPMRLGMVSRAEPLGRGTSIGVCIPLVS